MSSKIASVNTNERLITLEHYLNNPIRYYDTNFVIYDVDAANSLDAYYQTHSNPAYVLADGGYVVAIVIGLSNLQDALDEAADNGMLDSFQVSNEDYEAMSEEEQDELACLGNASEPFNITNLEVYECDATKFMFDSFIADQLGKDILDEAIWHLTHEGYEYNEAKVFLELHLAANFAEVN